MTKICVPILAKTNQEALRKIASAQKEADIIEIWLDQIIDLNISELFTIKEKPYLLVVKSINEKGNFSGSSLEKVNLLIQGINLGAEYIDIALDTDQEAIKKLIRNHQNSQIIISYHNFSDTPAIEKLQAIANQAFLLGASIIKIATVANFTDDNNTLIELATSLQEDRKPAIIIGMGETGKITRILAPKLKSIIMYAALDHQNESAPGQLTVKELQRAWGKMV